MGTPVASLQRGAFLARVAATLMYERPGVVAAVISRAAWPRPRRHRASTPPSHSDRPYQKGTVVLCDSDAGATAAADSAGRAEAERLQQANPCWCVTYALFWRKLVAIYMGSSPEPIVLSDKDPAGLEQSMHDVALALRVSREPFAFLFQRVFR